MDISLPYSLGDVFIGFDISVAALLITAAIVRQTRASNVYVLALAAKIVAAWGNTVYVFFIYHTGDSIGYHYNGALLSTALESDVVNGTTTYFASPLFFLLQGSSTVRMNSLAGFVQVFTLNSFIGTSVLFGVFGFIGQVLLFQTFTRVYPQPEIRKWWIVGIFLFPTLTFWSAGILKDTVGIFALGCAVWGAYRISARASLVGFLAAGAGFYLLILFRVQVVLVLAVALIPLLLFPSTGGVTQDNGVKKGTSRRLTGAVILRLLALVAIIALAQIVGQIEAKFAIQNLPNAVVTQSQAYAGTTNSGGVFESSGAINSTPSWTGLLLGWPLAFITTLFRPFPWEASGVVPLIASLENLTLLFLTARVVLRGLADRTLLRAYVHSPLFISAAIFVLLFTLGIGESTPNIGSISRYRIPLIPFLVCVLTIAELRWQEHEARASALMRRRRVRMRGRARPAPVKPLSSRRQLSD